MSSTFSVLMVWHINILPVFQNKAIGVELLKISDFFCASAVFLTYEIICSAERVMWKHIRRQETIKPVICTQLGSEADDTVSSKSWSSLETAGLQWAALPCC